MKEIFKQYKLPTSYLEFLDKYKNGLSQILYNSEDNINFDEALFYDLWSKETLFEDTFSDGPNYQIPLNIINEIIIDFKEPDYFNEKIVKNMFVIGLQDSGFLCFNSEDNSLCVLYPDGFITTIASSFDFFINNINSQFLMIKCKHITIYTRCSFIRNTSFTIIHIFCNIV